MPGLNPQAFCLFVVAGILAISAILRFTMYLALGSESAREYYGLTTSTNEESAEANALAIQPALVSPGGNGIESATARSEPATISTNPYLAPASDLGTIDPDPMPLSIQIALAALVAQLISNVLMMIIELALGLLNPAPLVSSAVGLLLMTGIYYRNRLALQWARVSGCVGGLVSIAMTYLAIGVCAVASEKVAMPAPFAGHSFAMPLMVATTVLMAISCGLMWTLFTSLGFYSARVWFRLICPGCRYDRGDAADFLFSRVRCKNCSREWDQETPPVPVKTALAMPPSSIPPMTAWKPVMLAGAAIITSGVILIFEGMPSLWSLVSTLAIVMATLLAVGVIAGQRTIRIGGLMISMLSALAIGIAALIQVIILAKPRSLDSPGGPTEFTFILYVVNSLIFFSMYHSLVALNEEKENRRACPSCDADIPQQVDEEFPIIVCRVCAWEQPKQPVPPSPLAKPRA